MVESGPKEYQGIEPKGTADGKEAWGPGSRVPRPSKYSRSVPG